MSDSSSSDHAGWLAHRRILIVDDESIVVDTTRALISNWLDIEIDVASDWNESIDAIAAQSYDLLLTDMNMPGNGGIERIESIRRAHPDMGIIVMTGFVEKFPFVQMIDAGADDFITKPFRSEELRAKIQRIFREHRDRHLRRRAENKYRYLFQMNQDGMLVLDGETFAIEDANDAFATMLGKSAQELNAVPLFDLLVPKDQMRLRPWLQVCANIGRGTLADVEFTGEDGTSSHCDLSATFSDSEEEKLIFLTFKDITERREVENQLADAAQKDELTGLYNKRSFHSRLEGAVQRAIKSGEKTMALLMIDLDNFKACNDTYGHQIGDKVLQIVGDAVHKCIRATDAGFCNGGDEFALIRRSDEALYRAKGAGKNAVELAAG